MVDSSSPGTDALGSSLCTGCGLCCMGVIHHSAVLDADEVEHARSLALPILETGRPAFALPCPRLEGTRCGIYRDRPRVCARYKCQLLQNFEAGARDLPDSIALVNRAIDLLRQVREAVPAGQSYADARRAHNPGGGETGARQLTLLSLELFLDRHFRNEKDRKSFDVEERGGMSELAMEQQLFLRSEDAIFAEVGDDVVALQVPKGRCHGMEEVAAEVWRIIERPSTLEDICAKLMASYEVDPDTCRADVAELLQAMLSEGLIKTE